MIEKFKMFLKSNAVIAMLAVVFALGLMVPFAPVESAYAQSSNATEEEQIARLEALIEKLVALLEARWPHIDWSHPGKGVMSDSDNKGSQQSASSTIKNAQNEIDKAQDALDEAEDDDEDTKYDTPEQNLVEELSGGRIGLEDDAMQLAPPTRQVFHLARTIHALHDSRPPPDTHALEGVAAATARRNVSTPERVLK